MSERAYEIAAHGILGKQHKFCFYTVFLPGLQSVCFWAQVLYPALEILKSIKVCQLSREQCWSARQMWGLERQHGKVIRALLWHPGFPLGQVIPLLWVSVYLSMKYRDNKSNSSSITHKSKSESQSESCFVVSDSLQPHGLYSPWNSPGQNTGVSSLSLLQGIFLIQGSNPGLPHCRQILYQLSHKRSPRILEWVAYPFSSGSSQPRNRTGVSCIEGGFFTN